MRRKGYRDLLDPKWVGKIRQGASGLQRHHPDCDLPDRPRCWLGLLRKACAAESHAGAIGIRSAQKTRARRSARIMADGIEYGILQPKETGKPVDVIYPDYRRFAADRRTERRPGNLLLTRTPQKGFCVAKSFTLSSECQQSQRRPWGLAYGVYKLVKGMFVGRKPLSETQGHEGRCSRRGKERANRSRRRFNTQYFKV